jgi:hypothetical protein
MAVEFQVNIYAHQHRQPAAFARKKTKKGSRPKSVTLILLVRLAGIEPTGESSDAEPVG